MLSPESITGGERKMVGSVMMFEADTLEEVEKIIKNDIYYTSGVVRPFFLLSYDTCNTIEFSGTQRNWSLRLL